jgi:hypothetical protein
VWAGEEYFGRRGEEAGEEDVAECGCLKKKLEYRKFIVAYDTRVAYGV